VRYVARTLIGLGLFAFCWAVIAYAIFQLLSTGTCASGGPYVVARECPAGIERVMLSLSGAIILLFVAAVIYGGRGRAPGSHRDPNPWLVVLWFWTGLFWSLAVGCFLAVWGPEASPGPGGELGGLIVGFMGLIMGAGGLLFVRWGPDERRRGRPSPVVTKVAETASRFAGAAPDTDRLATLARLRNEGSLTESEFQTLKDRIIRGKA
jgi:hypothetical protein